MRLFLLSTVMIAASLAAGCRVGYSATGAYAPDLVYVSPGVQVIADYDEPIFYVDNYYWRFSGGTWYRSASYTGGWVYATPPVVIRRIERPEVYVHYRPAGVAHRQPPQSAPVVREERGEGPRYEHPGEGPRYEHGDQGPQHERRAESEVAPPHGASQGHPLPPPQQVQQPGPGPQPGAPPRRPPPGRGNQGGGPPGQGSQGGPGNQGGPPGQGNQGGPPGHHGR
jgi:hypothetical protein